MSPLVTHNQDTPYSSPWTRAERVWMLVWDLTWTLLCAPTPKPFNPWRLQVLRWFGARIEGSPFVHQRARIAIPWNLTMHDRACLGDGAQAYSLGKIEIGAEATVAQEAYLCAGTHDFSHAALPLQTAPIRVGEGAFIGARAFILPGVEIGARAIVGAGAVVTKDVAAGQVVAGNPARVIGERGATKS